MTVKKELGTNEYLKHGQQCLTEQINIIKTVYEKLPKVTDSQAIVISSLAFQVMETSHSILVLSEIGKLGDCYALARIIFDHILNIGYIGSEGKEVVDKATKHAHQKVYRDLDRKITIKDITFGLGLENVDNIQVSEKLNEAIKEFTSSRGTELRNWTDTNVFKKIELIRNRYGKETGTILVINLFYIYRHASEIIHGSFFGALFTKGLTQLRSDWPKNHDEMQEFIRTYIGFVIQNVILLNAVMIKIIHQHYPMDDEKNQLDNLIKNYKQYI